MPKIATSGKYDFKIETREKDIHGPHVHVYIGTERICEIDLYSGMFLHEPDKAGLRKEILEAYRPLAVQLLKAWFKYHPKKDDS